VVLHPEPQRGDGQHALARGAHAHALVVAQVGLAAPAGRVLEGAVRSRIRCARLVAARVVLEGLFLPVARFLSSAPGPRVYCTSGVPSPRSFAVSLSTASYT
jgi:hypothetical protein